MEFYKPLEIKTEDVTGLEVSLRAARLSYDPEAFHSSKFTMEENLDLACKLVRAGSEHAKPMRGIHVYAHMRMQTGFMVELDTYRIGTETLMTSSTMHTDLKKMSGAELADAKQELLPFKQYVRVEMFSYQALRNIMNQRYNHKHPDWLIFCKWMETLPYFKELILGEK